MFNNLTKEQKDVAKRLISVIALLMILKSQSDSLFANKETEDEDKRENPIEYTGVYAVGIDSTTTGSISAIPMRIIPYLG